MPIEIDTTERMRQVVEAAHTLLLEGGLSAVTFRAMAAELGTSTTAVSHYFEDKREIVIATYRYSVARAERRRRALAKDTDSLIESLEAILPSNPESIEDWRVWISFYSEGLHDEKIGREQGAAARRLLNTVRKTLSEHRHVVLDVDLAARSLVSVLYGIAVQAIFDSEGWSPDQQRAVLSHNVRALVGDVHSDDMAAKP